MKSSAESVEVMGLYARYARRVDQGDLVGWSRLFARGATFEMRDVVRHGRKEILEGLQRTISPLTRDARHLIRNIEVGEGRPLSAVADMSVVVVRGGEAHIRQLGRYRSEFVREGEELRFSRH